MRKMQLTAAACRGVALAALVVVVAGCFGKSQNRNNLFTLPTGDIIRTHAKPPGHGYYGNFDRDSCCLSVKPDEATVLVGTQMVVKAAICDRHGNGLYKRRVEWMLGRGPDAVGEFVEVDESGYWAGRGYKVDNYYAISYTNHSAHTLTRGNSFRPDDVHLRRGETWAVVTSNVEGTSYLTVYAPEIYNWDCHKRFTKIHWVDAEWAFPPPAVNKAGTEHVFTTHVFRHSDRTPLKDWIIRYTILDGPPAAFKEGGAQTADGLTDAQGLGSVTLVQQNPQPGVNRIGIEIIRPAHGTTDPGVVVGRGQTTKEWQSPDITIHKEGPATGGVGADLTYAITVQNPGSIDARGVVVTDEIPEATTYVSSNPPAKQEANRLVWELGTLPPGATSAMQVTLKATRPGKITNCAEITTADGLRGRSCAATDIVTAQLTVEKRAPETAVVGQPVTFNIIVTNRGEAPATNVAVTDEFEAGFVHETGEDAVQLTIGTLAPGESKNLPIILKGMKPGRLRNHVSATADGGLTAEAEVFVNLSQPQIQLNMVGPRWRYVGRPAEFNITVTNPGNAPAQNVVVTGRFPAELTFKQAGQGGTAGPDGHSVTWPVGTLKPGERRPLQVELRCEKIAKELAVAANATGEFGLQAQASATIEVRGIPALLSEMVDLEDPIAVGQQTSYQIQVTNQGTLAEDQVQIVFDAPAELQIVDAKGPTPHKIEGQRVIFEPFNGLAPMMKLEYQIYAKGLKPGDVIVRARLTAGKLESPVTEEESTTIFQP